jgi:hypothetical protein
MTTGQRLVLAVEVILLAALAMGLIGRGRLRLCFTFGLYVAAVLGPDVAILARPSRFFTWDVWIARELVQALLKLGIPVEITLRAFAAFHGARARTASFLVVVAAGTILATALRASKDAGAAGLAQTMMPPLLTGTAWLFGAVLAFALWFRIPLHPWHRALLIGFVPYLLIFTIAVGLLRSLGWEARMVLSHAYTISYLVLVAYLAFAVWRRDPSPPAPSHLVHRLQPWRET